MTEKVTRFEVIDHRVGSYAPGRVFVAKPCRIELSYQDDGRTLKVFVTDGEAQSGEQPEAAQPSKHGENL